MQPCVSLGAVLNKNLMGHILMNCPSVYTACSRHSHGEVRAWIRAAEDEHDHDGGRKAEVLERIRRRARAAVRSKETDELLTAEKREMLDVLEKSLVAAEMAMEELRRSSRAKLRVFAGCVAYAQIHMMEEYEAGSKQNHRIMVKYLAFLYSRCAFHGPRAARPVAGKICFLNMQLLLHQALLLPPLRFDVSEEVQSLLVDLMNVWRSCCEKLWTDMLKRPSHVASDEEEDNCPCVDALLRYMANGHVTRQRRLRRSRRRLHLRPSPLRSSWTEILDENEVSTTENPGDERDVLMTDDPGDEWVDVEPEQHMSKSPPKRRPSWFVQPRKSARTATSWKTVKQTRDLSTRKRIEYKRYHERMASLPNAGVEGSAQRTIDQTGSRAYPPES
ncbi:hypothetical protein GGR56DRAFT_684367 [Xylariaceae sp. FL0804]|nr:hypothetical protein GGR56DRAFT_684367 [Xylariaceae sp. FL0804]